MNKFYLLLTVWLILGGCDSAEKKVPEDANSRETGTLIKKDDQLASTAQPGIGERVVEKDAEEAVVAEPTYRMKDDFSIQDIANPDRKVVLLTIDDAPDKYSLSMAKTLKEMNANAIFFVNGHFIDTPEEGEILKQIHQLGFSIGNHTLSHKSLKDLPIEQQRQEIVGLNDLIEKWIGERPKFFRAPFGVNTDYSRQVALEENMLLMNWTYGYDWEKDYQTKEALAEVMVHTPLLKNGANLLMHDRKWTAEALGEIVKGLQLKGFEIADPKQIETPGNEETAAQ